MNDGIYYDADHGVHQDENGGVYLWEGRKMGKKMKPAYEIVAAAELRVGDVVTIEPDLDPWVMDDVRLTESYLFYRGAGQATEFSMPRDRNIFRKLPPERNPDVLMLACEELAWKASRHGCVKTSEMLLEMAIEQAIRELESEAGDEQQGPSRTRTSDLHETRTSDNERRTTDTERGGAAG